MPAGDAARLVLVSNRGPVTYQEDGSVKRGTGGLVTALTGLAYVFSPQLGDLVHAVRDTGLDALRPPHPDVWAAITSGNSVNLLMR